MPWAALGVWPTPASGRHSVPTVLGWASGKGAGGLCAQIQVCFLQGHKVILGITHFQRMERQASS
jgi:hypothetical protein